MKAASSKRLLLPRDEVTILLAGHYAGLRHSDLHN